MVGILINRSENEVGLMVRPVWQEAVGTKPWSASQAITMTTADHQRCIMGR